MVATPGNAVNIKGAAGFQKFDGTNAFSSIADPIPLANGGTNANLTASNGGIFYSTGSAGAILAGTATANQVLLSGANTTPAWSTATYPATAGTSGNLLTSDGTNWSSTAPSGGAALKVASGTLTNSQCKNLNTTPITIDSAPGNGFYWSIVSCGQTLNYGGTNAFTDAATIQFQVAGILQVSFAATDHTGTSSSQSFNAPSINAGGSYNNGALTLKASANLTGNAANDNTISYYVVYYKAPCA